MDLYKTKKIINIPKTFIYITKKNSTLDLLKKKKNSMLNKIYHLSINPYLMATVIIIGLIGLLIFTIFIIYLLIDSVYQPKTGQIKSNIILDLICPVVLILFPTITIILIKPSEILLYQKCGYVMICHINIIIPLLYLWATHRNWDGENKIILSNILLSLAITIVYPFFGGLYISYIRYIRLHDNIDISIYFNDTIIGIIIFSLFVWRYTFVWFRLILWSIMDIKLFFWNNFKNFIYNIHIKILNYDFYHNLFLKIYKLSFIIVSYLTKNPFIYNINSIPFSQKVISILAHQQYYYGLVL